MKRGRKRGMGASPMQLAAPAERLPAANAWARRPCHEKMNTIDAHHHFWKYTPAEYAWIDDAMASIRRDFLPPDLTRAIAAANVDAVVSVQARQSLDETRWLLALARAND